MLEARNIHKIYRLQSAELHILKGLDLEMEKGDVLAITGPSGAGKSTLLHILGGLDQPDQGKVFVGGQDLYGLNDKRRASIRNTQIGFIFQFYHLLPEFTALENVMLPGLVAKEKKDVEGIKGKAADLLKDVGLSQRLKHKPNELSGGEQQRVAIARALINDPDIIFCDEPTGNLDSENGKAVLELLLELNARYGQTLVLVTHDEAIARCSKKIRHMRDGFFV